VLRRVAGEPALLLGGPRALLLQLAHPKIAAAVAEHSDFRERPWLRLWRTLDPLVLLVFGTEHQRQRALASVARTHDRVRGRLPGSAGRWRAGAAYSAHDRAAQAWVLMDLRMRARRLYWLNPEPRGYWDTGDSIVSEYGVHCDGVYECRNLRQLQRFVAAVVEA